MAEIFGKLKLGLEKGAQAVSVGSKTVIKKSALITNNKKLEKEIKDISVNIGTKLYNWCALNAEGDIPRDEFMSFVEEIAVRNEQIKENNLAIEELDAGMNKAKDMTFSCSCGQSNTIGASFCQGCGKPLN